MVSQNFRSYTEASVFAKTLAKSGVVHKMIREGSCWLVEHEALHENSHRHLEGRIDVQELYRNIESKNENIDSLTQRIVELQGEIDSRDRSLDSLRNLYLSLKKERDDLEKSISRKVSELVSKDKLKIEKEYKRLSSEIIHIKEGEEELKANKHKLELLEKAYAESFGEAEVRVVTEKVTSMEICHRCGGDGGIRSGCPTCDGRGLIDTIKEKIKEVVVFK